MDIYSHASLVMVPIMNVDPIDLEKFRNGDHAALKKVYEGMKTPLYNFIFRFVKAQATTHDLVGDTFVKLIENKARMQSYQNIKNFLYSAAHHLAIDFLRAQRTRQSTPIGDDFPDPHDPQPDPLQAIVRTELSNHQGYLYDLATKLIMNDSHEYIKVFRLHLKGNSTDQIAAILNISPNTVRNHIRRARKNIAEQLNVIYF
jgi:RNA polymerase sigma-70 factor (ECF subfamily)